jgi:MarR family
LIVTSWSFLTNHARVLLCIARDPGMRLRAIAASLGITERSAHGIVTDLTTAGYVLKQKDGRRNRYQIQAHLPLPEPASQEPAIGEVLALLAGASAGRQLTRGNQREASITAPDVATTESGGSGA